MNRRNGQAAIEFAAALLLMLLVVSGMIHVCRMARTSLFLHAVLRGAAGEQAMESHSFVTAAPYISDWKPGADNVRYTADDQKVSGGTRLSTTLSSLANHSVKTQGDWQYASESKLPSSLERLHSSPVMAAALGLVHKEETLYVPVDSVIRQLVYDKEEVAIKEEVWMPQMGGLY